MNPWPKLEFEVWKNTYQTLHRWLQIVGKLRLSLTEPMNHSWSSVMYVTPLGLTTSPIPLKDGSLSVDVEFSEHSLKFTTSNGKILSLHLQSESVAEFYFRFLQALKYFGIEVQLDMYPNELPDAIPFPEDKIHRTYQPEHVENLWHILVKVDLLLKKFRSRFTGKASPVHFFWGSFDLAVTRFSGQRAPEHPGGFPHLPDLIAKEAYSHEVSSCGFWPGNEIYPHAAFYSYAYPEPEGFKDVRLHTEGAFYHDSLHEFILPYEIVREHGKPDDLILNFFEETFRAAAALGDWDSDALAPSVFLQMLWQKFAYGVRPNR